MFELACHCLNVKIQHESNDFEKVMVDSLQLADDVLGDPFFRQETRWIRLVTSVTSQIPWLVGTRNVGSYSVHHCYNCDVHTHAVHRDHETIDVITSANLLDSAAIQAAKNDRQFSTSYNIKINTDIRNTPHAFINMLPDEKVIVNNLTLKANEYVNREMAAVEDRIRQYSEQQHAIFEKYKDRVMLEYEALYRKVLENKRRATKENSLSTKNLSTVTGTTKGSPKSVPENIASPRRTSLNDRANSNQISSPKPIAMNRVRVSELQQASSFDCEGFFPLDDMDDDPSFDNTISDESDTEPSGNYGRDITSEQNNMRRNSMHMARSLPVSIPPNACPFMTTFNNHLNDENDDQMPEESMDIAASIKALAKSIQGDTIFGDLPARPRFSSQI